VRLKSTFVKKNWGKILTFYATEAGVYKTVWTRRPSKYGPEFRIFDHDKLNKVSSSICSNSSKVKTAVVSFSVKLLLKGWHFCAVTNL